MNYTARLIVAVAAGICLLLNGASSYLRLRNGSLRDSWYSAVLAIVCAGVLVAVL